ncbi:MAG: hypothetical protein MJ010_03975 [Paludibacteraceae bacterium]|nr:hypothetical protein [Paludibacteraceae bacterium]
MKVIQTMYIGEEKYPLTDSFGWVKSEYNWMSWALSFLQLQKLYGDVTLYADEKGASFLVDKMGLSYANVVIFPKKFNLPHKDLWALPKLWTYSLQDKPFVHIDGDVYLFEKLPETLLCADVFAQNIEVATGYYKQMQNYIEQNFSYIPQTVKKDFTDSIQICALNAGILGGNDITLFKNYTEEAFRYVLNNVKSLQNVTADHFNVFFEQHLLYVMAKHKYANIKCLFKEHINDNGYKQMGDIYEAPKGRSYIHMLGCYKKDRFSCIQVAYKLKQLYPEYFERILKLYSDNSCEIESFPVKKTGVADFSKFNEYYNSIDRNDSVEFDGALLEFNQIKKEISDYLQGCNINYIESRDNHFCESYEKIFLNGNSCLIQRELYFKIIESEYDWGGLINSNERVGVAIYENWKFKRSHYINLLVPENTTVGFSLYDIEDIDVLILSLLEKPCTIHALKNNMLPYVESSDTQVINVFFNLIEESLKKLALYKVIKTA